MRRAWCQRSCGGIRVVVPLRAQRPGRRFALLPGQAALVRTPARRGRRELRRRATPLVIGGDFNVDARPTMMSGSAAAAHGGTHVSAPERAALASLARSASIDAYRAHRAGTRSLQLVGLPGRHVPQEPGHAHRPAVRDPDGRGRGSSGRRSTARRARARPRRPTTLPWSSTSMSPDALRCGMGGRPVPHPVTHTTSAHTGLRTMPPRRTRERLAHIL